MDQYIVQLAKLAGLKTLNVVRRPEAADQVRAFVGDAVVLQGDDLKEQTEAALGTNRLSIAFDTLGGEPIGHSCNSSEMAVLESGMRPNSRSECERSNDMAQPPGE